MVGFAFNARLVMVVNDRGKLMFEPIEEMLSFWHWWEKCWRGNGKKEEEEERSNNEKSEDQRQG